MSIRLKDVQKGEREIGGRNKKLNIFNGSLFLKIKNHVLVMQVCYDYWKTLKDEIFGKKCFVDAIMVNIVEE